MEEVFLYLVQKQTCISQSGIYSDMDSSFLIRINTGFSD